MEPTTQEREDFLRGYAQAMAWANTSSWAEIVRNGFDDTDYVSELSRKRGHWYVMGVLVEDDDALKFLSDNLETLRGVSDKYGADMSQHGHDFALTRNDHGAGFWDRGYGDVGDRLTASAHTFGEHSIWLGE